jgi:S1-C subfamily serine protease
MKVTWPDVFGLALGAALGWVALTWSWSGQKSPGATDGQVAGAPADPGVEAGRPGRQPTLQVRPVVQRPSPAAPARLGSAGQPGDQSGAPFVAVAPLPNVVHPEGPGEAQPGSVVSGTGFFIAPDGSLLTAAHVVSGCRRAQVASRFVPPSDATVIGSDARHDLALLRASRVRPPGLVPLALPSRATAPLGVLGFPGEGDELTPTEASGRLRNAELPQGEALANPQELVWIESQSVRKGFSGGPILDRSSWVAVGLVKGTLDPAYARSVFGTPIPPIAIGPGTGRITAFVREQAPWLDPTATVSDGSREEAVRAVVHVLCWR